MRNTVTIRLPEDLAERLEKTAPATGRSRGSIIREQLELARKAKDRPFMALAGAISGPRGLSQRKGFARQ